MSYELRPLTLAEIFDAAFRMVQTQWRTLVGLSAIMQAPLVLLGLSTPWIFDPFASPIEPGAEPTGQELLGLLGALSGMGLAYLILYPFVAASVTAAVAHLYLGRPFAFADAARAGLASVLRLVASYLVYMVALFGGLLIVGGAIAMATVLGGAMLREMLGSLGTPGIGLGIVLGFGVFVVFLLLMLYLGAVSALLPPVAVLESAGVVGTVNRSFALAATARGRVVLIVMTAGLIVGIPVGAAQAMIGFMPVVGILVWGGMQALAFAFTTSVAVVLYFDLRCRAEHYDLELLAEQVETGRGFADR